MIRLLGCEVWDVYGDTTLFGREAGEFGEAAPLGGIIDIDVEREAVSQTMDEAAVHGVVHLVIHTHVVAFFPCACAITIELTQQEGLCVLPREQFVINLEGGDGVFLHEAVRAAYGLKAGIRARGGAVEVESDGYAQLRGDDGGVVMTEERVAAEGIAGHGDQVHHTVATVETQQLGDGADGMGGVGISAAAYALFVEIAVAEEFAPVVDIGSFAMRDAAEGVGLDEFERGEVEPVVAAVFGHEAVALCTFGSQHYAPAIFDGRGEWHLDGYVFAVFEGFDGNVGVRLPVGTDIDDIYVRVSAYLAPCVFAGETLCHGSAAEGEVLIGACYGFWVQICHDANLCSGDIGVSLYGFQPTLTKADESHADHGKRFASQILDRCSCVHAAKIPIFCEIRKETCLNFTSTWQKKAFLRKYV